MKRVRIAAAAALVALALLAGGCHVQGKRQPYTAIGPDGEALRQAFNADVGKVRVLLLVAPT